MLTNAEICFGVNVEKPDRLTNHLLLIAKHFIYMSKLKSILPSFQSFLKIVRYTEKIEHQIAFDSQKLKSH